MANTKKQEALLEKIRKNFTIAEDYYSYQRAQAAEDFRFRMGDQWEPSIKNKRIRDGKPVMDVNKLPQFVRQVVNQQKENRPQINVKAGDANSDKKIANVLQAIIMKIQEQSFAENAYDVAFDNACTGGEGFIRIITDYSDNLSFDQDIFIKPIENPFSVYIDPNTCADYTNMKWAFIFDTITKEEFEDMYPNAEFLSAGYLVNQYEYNGWINSDEIRLAEYFWVECEYKTIVQLKDGTVLEKDVYDTLEDNENLEIIKTRKAEIKKVKYVKTNGYEILEQGVFPGEFIPVVPVYGDTYMVDGKKVTEGVIRQAKNPQRAYNYWVSTEIELIALAPKAPYLVAKGQIEGFEDQWNTANVENYPYLEYNPVASNGMQGPPPARQQFDPAINTVVAARQSANEDLKATTGIYDPSLGKEQKEASGVAIITKQQQSTLTSFMYSDNLCKSLKQLGRILLQIIPTVYDNERVLNLLMDNTKGEEIVKLNSPDEESVFLGMGKYEASISIGPYGENQRQEAIESMLALMQIKPELVDIMGDIFVGKQDWAGAQEIAERLKIMLPPALQGQQDLPPEVQAAIAQGQQQLAVQQQQLAEQQAMIANLTAAVNQYKNEANDKTAERESKERIEFAKINRDLVLAGIKEDAADSRLAFEQELKYSAIKQTQGNPQTPPMGDEVVLAGVNDPITEAQNDQGGELSPEEQQKLLDGLNNYIDSPVDDGKNPLNNTTYQ